MYELISNLILYGNLPEDEILVQLANEEFDTLLRAPAGGTPLPVVYCPGRAPLS